MIASVTIKKVNEKPDSIQEETLTTQISVSDNQWLIESISILNFKAKKEQ